MPTYTAKAYLSNNGGVVKPGQQIDLTEEQAKRLGDKVEPFNADAPVSTDVVYTEAQFRKLSPDKQKELVTQYDGDLNEYTNEDKRWAFVNDNQ